MLERTAESARAWFCCSGSCDQWRESHAGAREAADAVIADPSQWSTLMRFRTARLGRIRYLDGTEGHKPSFRRCETCSVFGRLEQMERVAQPAEGGFVMS